MVTGFLTMVIMFAVNNQFHGLVVAKMPFEPISLITSMTHRGVKGEDY